MMTLKAERSYQSCDVKQSAVLCSVVRRAAALALLFYLLKNAVATSVSLPKSSISAQHHMSYLHCSMTEEEQNASESLSTALNSSHLFSPLISPLTSTLLDIRAALKTDIHYAIPDNYMRGAGDTYFSGQITQCLSA